MAQYKIKNLDKEIINTSAQTINPEAPQEEDMPKNSPFDK